MRYFYLIRGVIRIATTGGRVSRVAVHPMDGGVLNGHKDNGEGHPTTPQGPERVAAQVFTGHDEGRRLL